MPGEGDGKTTAGLAWKELERSQGGSAGIRPGATAGGFPAHPGGGISGLPETSQGWPTHKQGRHDLPTTSAFSTYPQTRATAKAAERAKATLAGKGQETAAPPWVHALL